MSPTTPRRAKTKPFRCVRWAVTWNDGDSPWLYKSKRAAGACGFANHPSVDRIVRVAVQEIKERRRGK
jgi:hypothetical protein